MSTILVSNGRQIADKDIKCIQRLIQDNPSWTRTRLSQELCRLWGWYAPSGRIKDMTCRVFLRKLDRRNLIALPPAVHSGNNQFRNQKIPHILHCTDKIDDELKSLIPLRIVKACTNKFDLDLFKCLLERYHYLGYKGSPGESIPYLILDQYQRPLAALLFAAAAWKIAPRDKLIGWCPTTRQRNLSYLTNNQRFLILPWVQVANLASHILSRVVKRLNTDWIIHYKHPLYLAETFVDTSQFGGASYRAANWIRIGKTKGRTRQDQHRTLKVPIKDIYLYPLHKFFKEKLNQ